MENIKLIAIDKAKLTLNGVKLPERYVDKFKTWLEQIEEVNKRTKKLLPKGTRL